MPPEKQGRLQALRNICFGNPSYGFLHRPSVGLGIASYLSYILETLQSPFSREQQRGARHRDIPATIIGWLIAAIVLSGLIYVFYVTEARGGWPYLRHEMGW